VYGVLDCTAELAGFLLVTTGGAMHVGIAYIVGLLGIMITSLVMLWHVEGETKRPK
jgi:hypothetical protein